MKTLIVTILALMMCGCVYVPVGTINSEGTGYEIDHAAIKKFGLDASTVKRHDDGHLAGYYHCENANCLMYPSLNKGEIKHKICQTCWISRTWKGNTAPKPDCPGDTAKATL